tara:strand:+ start:2675 stop:2974 length:300 start_codon:yes stop_codon:yes gene_type:complete
MALKKPHIANADDSKLEPFFSKFGFTYDNGEFHKHENGIHYVLYTGLMTDFEGRFLERVCTYTIRKDALDEKILRDIPEKVIDHLTFIEREKTINKIIN